MKNSRTLNFNDSKIITIRESRQAIHMANPELAICSLHIFKCDGSYLQRYASNDNHSINLDNETDCFQVDKEFVVELSPSDSLSSCIKVSAG